MARKKSKNQKGRGLITEAECKRRNSLSNRFKSAMGVSSQPQSMKEKFAQGARDFQDKAREQLTSLQDNTPREPPPSDCRGLASALIEQSSVRAVGGKKRGGKEHIRKKRVMVLLKERIMIIKIKREEQKYQMMLAPRNMIKHYQSLMTSFNILQ